MNINERILFEDALTLTCVGKYNYILATISILSLLAAACEIFGLGIILASAQCDLELDIYKRAIANSVPMMGVVFSAHLWGYIADTKGRKFALQITMSGTFIIALISGFVNNWILFTITKFLSTAFASGTNAVVYTMLGEKTPAAQRSKFLMFTSSGVMLSYFTLSVISWPILSLSFSIPLDILGYNFRPWRLLVFTYGLLSALCLLALQFLLYESPKFHFAHGKNELGLKVLKKMFVINTGKNKDEYCVHDVILQEDLAPSSKNQNLLTSMWNQTVPLFRKEHLKKTFLMFYLAIVAFSSSPPLTAWMPNIFDAYSEDLNTDKNFCQLMMKSTQIYNNVTDTILTCTDSVSSFSFMCMSAISLYMTVVTVLSIFVTRCIGMKTMLISIHVISAICALTINFVYNIGGIVIFFGLMSCMLGLAIVTTYAVILFPTYLRAMAVCLTMMIGRGFSSVFLNLDGPQLKYNCDNFMYMLATFIFSGAVVALFLPKDGSKPGMNEDNNNSTESTVPTSTSIETNVTQM